MPTVMSFRARSPFPFLGIVSSVQSAILIKKIFAGREGELNGTKYHLITKRNLGTKDTPARGNPG